MGEEEEEEEEEERYSWASSLTTYMTHSSESVANC